MMTNDGESDSEIFSDFSLKLVGELSPLSGSSVGEEGFWVASCGIVVNGELTSR